VNGWNMDMDQLARDMHAYTLEHIGYTIAQQQEEKQRDLARSKTANVTATGPAPSSRLRPKAPAKRWAERHPEEAARLGGAAAAAGQSGSDGDNTESGDDEDGDDYVMETYYRVPVSALAAAAVPPERVGLLVLDSAPDVEYFYGEGSGSEEEYDEEDEDENG
jgi:hypothetical protein